MKFIIDNQLPPKLAQWITAQGHEALHLQEVGLQDARDIQVLEFANNHGMVLVSKDEDFLHLALTRPGTSQVVWVRLGNCRTRSLLTIFGQAFPAMIAALSSGQTIVELR